MTEPRPALSITLAAAIVLWLPGALAAQDVVLEPGQADSHKSFLKHLDGSRGQVRKELIARYDAHLARSPDDHVAAIERCKFVEMSIPVDDISVDKGPTCAETLESRYGLLPAVVLYRLSTMWGDGAIAYGLQRLDDPKITWTPADRAMALGRLGDLHHGLGRLDEASRFAQRAWEQDPSYDRSLLVAEHLNSVGQRKAAIDMLSSHLAAPTDTRQLFRKAQLLLELDEPTLALAVIKAAPEGGAEIDPILRGQVLERAGDAEGARAVYAGLSEDWSRQEALTRLFYLEVRQLDSTKAVDAYRALRNFGWSADPVARHRLALAWHHPRASWRLADLTGLLALVAMIGLAAVLPAVVALPVHHVGLWRRARGRPSVDSRWRLRHAWIAFSLLIVNGLLATYVFAYEEIATWFVGYGEASHTQLSLARAGVLSFALAAASAAGFARRPDWRGLAPRQWMNRQVLVTALKYLLILIAIAAISRAVSAAFAAAVTAETGIALSTLAVLRAMNDVYRPETLLLFAVVIVPISEEFLFREIALDALGRHVPFGWANTIQAVVFAFWHDTLAMAPFLVAFGLITGMLRRRTGSLATGTVLHALINLVGSLRIMM
jgi:membrane protease YdiL (CAAX protease family)